MWTATYDRTTKIVTALVCALLLAICLMTRSTLVGALSAFVLALAFAWSPRSYALAGGNLMVRRLIGKVNIPLDTLREARAVTSDDLRGCLRLWGSGGLFGYYGLFQTTGLGLCHWYVTDKSRLVVLKAAAKTILVSPDDPDGFLASLHPVPSEAPPATATSVSRFRVAALGIAFAAVVVGLPALLLMWSPGAPALTLTPRALQIQDRFYPVTVNAADVNAALIQVVDVTGNSEWRPTRKTNGFSNLHYRSGWFRVAGGSTVRLYRADATRLVLLPPRANGTPVLFEVKDPDQFAERLRGLWSPAR